MPPHSKESITKSSDSWHFARNMIALLTFSLWLFLSENNRTLILYEICIKLITVCNSIFKLTLYVSFFVHFIFLNKHIFTWSENNNLKQWVILTDGYYFKSRLILNKLFKINRWYITRKHILATKNYFTIYTFFYVVNFKYITREELFVCLRVKTRTHWLSLLVAIFTSTNVSCTSVDRRSKEPPFLPLSLSLSLSTPLAKSFRSNASIQKQWNLWSIKYRSICLKYVTRNKISIYVGTIDKKIILRKISYTTKKNTGK